MRGRMLQLFRRMTATLRIQDLQFLLNLKELSGVLRVYSEQEERLLDCSDWIPWPVRWLLCRFNRKHCHTGRCLPRLEPVADALQQFENKTRWKWWHECGPESEEKHKEKSFLRVKDVRTPACGKLCPPELTCWLGAVHGAVWDAVRQSRSKARASKHWSNVGPLVRWARDIMKRNNWTTLPLDKEPGSVLVLRSSVRSIHEKVLAKPCYSREVRALDVLERDVKNEYYVMANKLGRLEE